MPFGLIYRISNLILHRSLLTIGLGGSIPLVNQLLSLLFMVAVQLVIVIEWWLSVGTMGPALNEEGYPMCGGIGRLRFFLLHIYPCALALLAFFYGVSVVNFRPNFHEGRLIAFALIIVIPVMAIWLLVQVQYEQRSKCPVCRFHCQDCQT